jgi:hypothetical protein
MGSRTEMTATYDWRHNSQGDLTERMTGVLEKLSKAKRNDFLRDTLCTFGPSTFVITQGVAALDEDAQSRVIGAMVEFKFYSKGTSEDARPTHGTEHGGGNDPYSEHDFGKVTVDGVDYFWKIDEVPAPVLTLMRADEY